MKQMYPCPRCSCSVDFSAKFCGKCGIPLTRQQHIAEQKQPLTAKVELLANECDLFMACLSWVACDLAQMKWAIQELDKKTEKAKALLGGEGKVEELKRNVVHMVDTLAPLVNYQEKYFLSSIAKFFDDNAMVSNEEKVKFFKTMQDRTGDLQRIQDMKLNVDTMLQVSSVIE